MQRTGTVSSHIPSFPCSMEKLWRFLSFHSCTLVFASGLVTKSCQWERKAALLGHRAFAYREGTTPLLLHEETKSRAHLARSSLENSVCVK